MDRHAVSSRDLATPLVVRPDAVRVGRLRRGEIDAHEIAAVVGAPDSRKRAVPEADRSHRLENGGAGLPFACGVSGPKAKLADGDCGQYQGRGHNSSLHTCA